jgi:hypothetical protein
MVAVEADRQGLPYWENRPFVGTDTHLPETAHAIENLCYFHFKNVNAFKISLLGVFIPV